MRLTLTLLFLLSTSIAHGQVTVGGSYSKEEIAKAKAAEATARAIINAADGVKLQLNVDQFECVHPKKDASSSSPLLWITNDETIVERIEIEAGTPLIFRGVRAGDTAKKTHYFSAQPFRWAVLIGSKEGGAKLVAVQNGAANQAPAIYGEVNVTVGKGPKPPDPPDPDPDPTPIPEQGFRVLIVTETANMSELPSSQLAAIRSIDVLGYLNQKTVKVNGHPEYRIWDQHTPIEKESAIWKQAMKLERKSLPWLIISNGSTGYSGPLPKTKDELLAKLKQYGGN